MNASTHDWERSVDAAHIAQLRGDPVTYAPGGVLHLTLEILAYVADEESRCIVTVHRDGSIRVADDGRGTEMRGDKRKPVMATKDLRFFDSPDVQRLPDGYPRRGASTVTALSTWLIHTSRRRDGAWTQRYEHGRPVTGLRPIPAIGRTGTTVHFLPDAGLVGEARLDLPVVVELARRAWPSTLIIAGSHVDSQSRPA